MHIRLGQKLQSNQYVMVCGTGWPKNGLISGMNESSQQAPAERSGPLAGVWCPVAGLTHPRGGLGWRLGAQSALRGRAPILPTRAGMIRAGGDGDVRDTGSFEA
jgi:hypothetical protein